jgi:hypothetical protein
VLRARYFWEKLPGAGRVVIGSRMRDEWGLVVAWRGEERNSGALEDRLPAPGEWCGKVPEKATRTLSELLVFADCLQRFLAFLDWHSKDMCGFCCLRFPAVWCEKVGISVFCRGLL